MFHTKGIGWSISNMFLVCCDGLQIISIKIWNERPLEFLNHKCESGNRLDFWLQNMNRATAGVSELEKTNYFRIWCNPRGRIRISYKSSQTSKPGFKKAPPSDVKERWFMDQILPDHLVEEMCTHTNKCAKANVQNWTDVTVPEMRAYFAIRGLQSIAVILQILAPVAQKQTSVLLSSRLRKDKATETSAKFIIYNIIVRSEIKVFFKHLLKFKKVYKH